MQKKYKIRVVKFNDIFTNKYLHKQHLDQKIEHYHHPRESFVPPSSHYTPPRETTILMSNTRE